MIRLSNATTDLLACTPSSTNVLKTLVSYSDKTSSSYTGASEAHSLAAASKATICGTPGASTVRDIDHVTISASGGANTVTVLQTISATDYQIISVALSSGDTLEWTHSHGWQVLDSNGSVKFTLGNVTGNLTIGGTLTVTGATTLSSALTYGGVTLSNAVTGTGNMVLDTSPTLVTPILGTPTSGTLTNCTIPASALTGTTMAASVVTSSLTTVGALTAGSIGGSFGAINIGSNSITGGAISGTTGAFSGIVTSTAAGNQAVLTNVSGGTGYQYIGLSNTSGIMQIGNNGSALGAVMTGIPAYAAYFTTLTNNPIYIGVNSIPIGVFSSTGLAVTGALSATTTIQPGGYTVAGLPAAGTKGRMAYVTDATAPTYLGALTGGGTVNTPVFDNGAAWVSF